MEDQPLEDPPPEDVPIHTAEGPGSDPPEDVLPTGAENADITDDAKPVGPVAGYHPFWACDTPPRSLCL